MKSSSQLNRRLACVLALVAMLLGGVVDSSAENRGTGPATKAQPTPESEKVSAGLGIGRWIWTTNFTDKQSCRLWRAFTIPSTNSVRKANLVLTADNLYRVYLDGREIGQGGNWKALTDYDVTWVLSPGVHVLAVDALNDGLEGGLILGLKVEFADGKKLEVLSDNSWYVVPNNSLRWLKRNSPDPRWEHAVEVGVVGQAPWWLYPISTVSPPPLLPEVLRFWQSGWFLGAVLSVAIMALAASVWLAAKLVVQTRAQKLLERERALIARDIHDDLGAGLTQLVLQGEVARTEFSEGSTARERLDQLTDKARAVTHSLEEVLWAVNSKRDTLRDFTTYLCKYAQSFLNTTSIRCRLDVQSEMPASAFDLPVRRSLFLAVKEALNNAAKHSGATELFLRINRERDRVLVVVEDNGQGFDPTAMTEGNGLFNMQQRLAEMGGECLFRTATGAGCIVEFNMPLAHPLRAESWWRRLLRRSDPINTELNLEP